MRTPVGKRALRRLRGSILAVTVALLALSSIGTLLMARTFLDHQSLNTRRRALWKAFYAAEAGVPLVQHWGMYPRDFTPAPNMFERIDLNNLSADELSQYFGDGMIDVNSSPAYLFPNLTSALGLGGYLIDADTLSAMNAHNLDSGHGYEVSNLDSVELLAADPSAGLPAHLFRVRSVGSSDGISRTVMSYMAINPLITIQIPAGLISFQGQGAKGNARVHWGEVWAKHDIEVMGASKLRYLNATDPDYDPWVRYRTEQRLDFSDADGWNWGEGLDLIGPNRDQPGAAPASGDFENAFLQNQPPESFDWPDFLSKYQDFKEFALAHGRYYSTDAAGNVYEGGVEDTNHVVDVLIEFGQADRTDAPYDMVFIDTINGEAPQPDGSNIATIRISGSGSGLKGVYFINANIDATGIGSPPTVGAEDPAGQQRDLDKIFLDGVLYSSGWVDMGGNSGVYGSVIAQRGFTGGGTTNIYYNARLANGLVIDNGNVGAIFKVVLHTNY